jgi:hypothetical protein
MRKEVTKATRQVRIPFGPFQVLAILAGTKDVTRRPVREDVQHFSGRCSRRDAAWGDPTAWGVFVDDDFRSLAPGDASDDLVLPSRYRAGDLMIGTEGWRPVYSRKGDIAYVEYRADGTLRVIEDSELREKIEAAWESGRRDWRPARFMPGGAARIRTPILDVRAERLQTIDPSDVAREGIGWETCDRTVFQEPVEFFSHSWDLMYGEVFPWEDDPWCRRIRFEPVMRKGESRG